MARHSKESEHVSKGILALLIFTGIVLVVGLSALSTKIISRIGTKTSTTITGEVKTISANIEETIVTPEVEQKVSVKQDPEITAKMLEIAKQNVEKEVEYKDKKIKIVKAKVSDEEDGKVQDKGGDHVSEFEVVGAYKGIDVSHHNGTINWAAVKAAGYDFAIIKVGGRGYGSGAIYQDTQ